MLSENSLKGKVAIITGGGTGIGLAIAKRLGALGAILVIGSRNSRNLERGSADLRLAGFDSLAVQLDVRKTEQVDEMVHRVLHHYGRIDILINNAAGNFISRAEDLSPNGWDAVIGIVLNGSFYCTRAVGRHMIERGRGGAIVSVLANYVWTGSAGHGAFRRGQGWCHVDDADARRRMGAPSHPRERRRPWADRVRGGRPPALELARSRRTDYPDRAVGPLGSTVGSR